MHWRKVAKADNVDAYVSRVLFNVFLAEERKPWRKRHVLTSNPPAADLSPTRETEPSDRLLRALQSLGPSQRAIVVLRYWQDLSVEQTANVLHCSQGNVKSQSARAIQQLKRALRDGQAMADGETP